MYNHDMQRWAITQAMYANVNFRQRDSNGRAIDEPFTADDFLGRGKRRATRELESKASSLAAAVINTNLARIVPGAPPTDDVPDWAKGPYRA